MIRLLTLTQHPDEPKPIMTAFNNFKANLNNWGYEFSYKWVKEHTPESHEYIDDQGNIRQSVGGVLHLHLLINVAIPSHLIKLAWQFANERSFIVHVVRVVESIGNPAGYLKKYLVKASQSGLFKKHEHRHGNDRKHNWKPVTWWEKPLNAKYEFERKPSPMKVSAEVQACLARISARLATRGAFTVANQDNTIGYDPP